MTATTKSVRAIVAATGYEGRAERIRSFCRKGAPVELRREPGNAHDKDAIAVYMQCSVLFGLWRPWRSIGYIKAARADGLAPKIDSGAYAVRAAHVHSFYAGEGKDHPRVSVQIAQSGRRRCESGPDPDPCRARRFVGRRPPRPARSVPAWTLVAGLAQHGPARHLRGDNGKPLPSECNGASVGRLAACDAVGVGTCLI